MPVGIFYVDESYDEQLFCLSAFCIRHSEWKQAAEMIREFRKRLKTEYGLLISAEVHATDLVGGRGKITKEGNFIPKWTRAKIFNELLELVARLPSVKLFNVCLKKSEFRDPEIVAWERLTNRIERTMLCFEETESKMRTALVHVASANLGKEQLEALSLRLKSYHARAIIFADKGKEGQITKRLRKMAVFNLIPSQYGAWSDGNSKKNITTDHIIEDPVFVDSQKSVFIQLADCVAFALLKKEAQPTKNIAKYGIQNAFDASLTGICYRKASPKDPLGIVRK